MGEAIGLFLSTVLLRPYVFLFLALYLWVAAAAIGKLLRQERREPAER